MTSCGAQAGGGGGSARIDAFDQGALHAVESQTQCFVRLEDLHELSPQVAALDGAFVSSWSMTRLTMLTGMLKATPRVAAAGRSDGGVDADHFAVQIDQGAAAGARIDGGVGLQEVLDADLVAEARPGRDRGR